jgi:hypothetical protein
MHIAEQCKQLVLWLFIPLFKDYLSRRVYVLWFYIRKLLALLLLLDSFDQSDLEEIKELCQRIVALIEEIFGPTAVTMKMHMLLHIQHYCKRLGPLKYVWCFPIENLLSFIR